MEFYSRILSKEVNILGIDNFDVHNWYDANQLKNVYRSLFFNNDMLYFSFRREENLTNVKELKILRRKMLETFKNEGEYVVLKQLDETRFDSVAKVVVKGSTFDFLFDLWNYFYSCTFFIPRDGFSFSDYIDFQKRINFEDKGGEKLIRSGYTDFECIKGLGGDSLIISYRKDYKLPDLGKAALDSPGKNQIFR